MAAKKKNVFNSKKLKLFCFLKIKPFRVISNLDISYLIWFDRSSSGNAN